MNIAFHYHALPPVDDMLLAFTPPDMAAKPNDAVDSWINSEIDALLLSVSQAIKFESCILT